METAKFTSEMVEMIKGVIGDDFCDYECGCVTHDETYGNLRMNFGKSSLEFFNVVSEFPFYDSTEEISCFTCERRPCSSQFKPYCDEPSERYPINETVRAISIVEDEIFVNDGEYQIAFDMAVIIETDEHRYIFSRGWFFAETIRISVDREFDEIYPVERVVEDWSDEGENKVSVCRSVRKL